MKRLPLSQGQFALVDDADFESVSRFNWYVAKGYVRTRVYLGMIGEKKMRSNMYLHRLIMRPPQHLEVDHINHNKLDCRRENMRICSHQQNLHNQVSRRGTSSRFKGVSWYKRAAKWQVEIRLNSKRIHLGYFSDEVDAARAYDSAAKEIFGEFAHLNFEEKQNAIN